MAWVVAINRTVKSTELMSATRYYPVDPLKIIPTKGAWLAAFTVKSPLAMDHWVFGGRVAVVQQVNTVFGQTNLIPVRIGEDRTILDLRPHKVIKHLTYFPPHYISVITLLVSFYLPNQEEKSTGAIKGFD